MLRQYKKSLVFASFAPLFALQSMPAFAGGYQITERNAQGLGRAYAGEAAIARDASTVGSNPAGMSRLVRPSFSVSAATVDANLHVDVKEAGVRVPALAAAGIPILPASGETYSNEVAPEYPIIPSAYGVLPLNERMAVGLGVFSNFSARTDYDAAFIGSLLAEKSEVTTINVNPSFAYQVNPKLAVGIGFNAVYAKAKLSSANPAVGPLRLNNANLLNPTTGEVIVAPTGSTLGSSEITGDDWAYGWNAGVLLEPTLGTRIGLAYRSVVSARLEGDAKFYGVPRVDAFTDFAGLAPLTIPAIASISVVQNVGDAWALSADITNTRWSSFDDLTIYRKDTGATSSRVQEDWQDANRYSVGVDYAALPALELRAGFALDETPIPDSHRTLRIPTGDMRWYSLGASYQFNEMVSVDAGWAYVRMSRVAISDKREFVGQSFTAELNGSARSDGNIFGTQLNVTL